MTKKKEREKHDNKSAKMSLIRFCKDEDLMRLTLFFLLFPFFFCL